MLKLLESLVNFVLSLFDTILSVIDYIVQCCTYLFATVIEFIKYFNYIPVFLLAPLVIVLIYNLLCWVLEKVK